MFPSYSKKVIVYIKNNIIFIIKIMFLYQTLQLINIAIQSNLIFIVVLNKYYCICQ